uniref:Uncharacterized protein n=1 Tax=Moniliophthora roreri TaxID=221103 RepID=A0A0W0FXQ0_MONRR
MHGVIRFLDTEILPASAPEGFPKVIKSGINEEGQHPKSPPITGPDGIATLLYRVGYPEALEKLLDTENTKQFDLRVHTGIKWLQDVYVQRRGNHIEIGFIDTTTGELAHHGVRYIIQRDPAQRVGKWVPHSTSDLGSPWGGTQIWVRGQGAAVTKSIWYNKLYEAETIDISWSGMTASDKDKLASFMEGRRIRLAETRARASAMYEERKAQIDDQFDGDQIKQAYHRHQMSCRADCGEMNPKLQCSKCKFTQVDEVSEPRIQTEAKKSVS